MIGKQVLRGEVASLLAQNEDIKGNVAPVLLNAAGELWTLDEAGTPIQIGGGGGGVGLAQYFEEDTTITNNIPIVIQHDLDLLNPYGFQIQVRAKTGASSGKLVDGSDISISDVGAGISSFILTLYPGGLGATEDYDIVVIGQPE